MSERLGLLLILLLGLALPGWAATTRYVSSGGSGSACTSGSPCSLDTAKGQAAPGDTITLGNGTYSGVTNIDCNSNAQNGTSSLRITLKATNERQAHLIGTGESPLGIYNCAYWTFEGLHIENVDNSATADCCSGAPIYTQSSHHNIYRRLLVHHNNRWNNSQGIEFYLSDDNLIEENELYEFHRHGITIQQGFRNIIRRNYVNSRGFPDLSGCTGSTGTRVPGTPRCSNNGERGDTGIQLYPGADNIIENNISEGQQYGFELIARYGAATGNRWFGNLANANQYGFSLTAGCDNPTGQDMPTNAVLQDNVSMSNEHRGFRLRSPKNAQGHHNTVIGGLDEGAWYADLDAGCPGDGAPTSFVDNFLATHTSSVSAYGINVSGQTSWSADYLNIFNYSSNSPSLADSHVSHATTTNPALGACDAWMPDASPMKGAGSGGTDLGATILYRYQDGALTTTPLWDPSTGAFPCGAVVTGVNDNTANNCTGIPSRFHINQGGCAFPSGYGGGPPVEPPPAGPNGAVQAVWHLNAGAGTPVGDSVGDHPGVFTPTAGWVLPGLLGAAGGDFDGARSVQVSNVTGLRNPNAATLSAWIKFNGIGDTCDVVSNGDATYIRLQPAGTATGGFYDGTTWPAVTGGSTLGNNQRRHLLWTYDQANQNLWVDGVLVATSPQTSPINYSLGPLFKIGEHANSRAYYTCTGVIDEVTVLNGPCDAACVANLYAAKDRRSRRLLRAQ